MRRERVQLARHPALECRARRLGLGHPYDGSLHLPRDSYHALCRRIARLTVVEEQTHYLRSLSKAATSEVRGSVLLITASWKRSLRILKPSAFAMYPNTGSVAG
jgi:hypothetical protein